MEKDTQAIDSELKSLTRKEIVSAALPYVIPPSKAKTRETLLAYLKDCPLEVRGRVDATAKTHLATALARKRELKAEKNQRYQNKRQKQDTCPDHDYNLDQFLDLPSPEEQKDCRRAFLAATSNQALAQAVCASCSRLLFQNDLTQVNYLELKNRHVFEPATPHEKHILSHGMLLDNVDLDKSGDRRLVGWICQHCSSAHNLGKRPAYSLANDMWTGEAPPILATLTLPERLLISLRFPRAYVIKLFLKGGRGTDHPLAIQTQLKGNVTTYHTNVDAVKQMLQGELMPRRTSVLPSLVAVTFIGRSNIAKSRLKSLFRVRRKVVQEALLVLKTITKHPGYADLDISYNAINTLPEDDVPEEIYAAVRWDNDEDTVIRESAGYVPTDPENGAVIINISHDESDLNCLNTNGSLTSDPGVHLQDNTTEEADVIPLEYSGMAAADESQITPQELMRSALKKLTPELQEQMTDEGGYLIRHGEFARDFGPALSKRQEEDKEEPNPSVYIFPHLFPYGVGGLETRREVPVSFVEHIRCLLQRRDTRFRKDSVFPFWALSLEQKRQALHAAQLTMSRKDFDRVCTAVGELKPEDYRRAAQDEEQGIRNQDLKVALLKKAVRVTMQKVMGSDASRALNRSKIWSTSLYLNPVNLWITLNFIDRHDPICQVFAGKEINMDDFARVVNLSAQSRAINVAQDPFAATQFFFFLAKTVLKTLFGFAVDNRLSKNQMGELGEGSAYFGAVEAQGRGSLHLHLMMWLANSPDADEITYKLQSPDFREKIKGYMRQNIRAHVDGLTEDTLEVMESESAIAWGRPPNPDSPSYEEDMRELEVRLAHAQQYHKCTPNTCQRYDKRKRKLVCKRKAPFELSPEDIVTESGEIHPKRLIKWLNTWCPAVFYGGRCNNDIKFITNGAIARALIWYITFYVTKKQGASYNQSAVIENTYAYHVEKSPKSEDAREQNRQFIFRCGMSLNREMEYSGQQAMAYLMGYGDTIQSHTYVTIWWSTVVSALKRTFPELAPNAGKHKASNSEEDESDVSRVDFRNNGTIYLRSQIDDYQYRAIEFESLFFLDYLVNTYEERVKKQPTSEPNSSSPHGQPGPSVKSRGRPQNTRAQYQPGHPRAETHQRVLRSTGHRTLPNIVGPWFERRNDPNVYPLYCASVLAALKPWRNLADLKSGFDTWDEALDAFLLVANRHQKSIRANMQYYYECKDSADQGEDGETSDEPYSESEDEVDLQEHINGIALDKLIMSRAKRKEIEHAEKAAEIGARVGMFGSSNISSDVPWTVTRSSVTAGNLEQVTGWTQALHQAAVQHLRNLTSEPTAEAQTSTGCIETMIMDPEDSPIDTPTVTYEGDITSTPDIDVSGLSTEQLRAFEIVKNHFLEARTGSKPEQLLMQIQGAGGTGKSLVISKITDFFRSHGKASKLRKSAYTGIAASLIEGSTLHQLAALHLCNRMSKKTIARLQETWQPVEYLIIDEISMVSKKVLADISQMISIGKQKENENNSTVAFGGVNIIIAGDFHQFPPVIGGGGNGALYTPVTPTATSKMITGRSIYEQFRTVVILQKQFRVEDKEWSGTLTRARHGKCTPKDLEAIRGLILDPTRDKNLLAQPGWDEAVLVTPRHSVRHRWNELASYNHCRSTGQQLFISHAYDTHNDEPLDNKTKALVQAQLFTGKAADGTPVKGDAGGLPDTVFVAVGMKVMVTYNIETDLDVANGARGTVVQIITGDSNVTGSHAGHLQELSRPPICVLVKLWRTKIKKLGDLDEGVIPIVPMRTRFSLKLPNKKELTIWREQLPLTPAYAFTDYRSQGQTIPYIIMDLATPPTGGLTPFNGYVTISRSRTSKTARLLRDFDDKLFTTPPNEHLVLEDKRLEELDRLTANKHYNSTLIEGSTSFS
ncbi:ATP-dependent DNA helicase PIF1, partial [Rhizoctonia solani AG-3 Rhs1AP]